MKTKTQIPSILLALLLCVSVLFGFVYVISPFSFLNQVSEAQANTKSVSDIKTLEALTENLEGVNAQDIADAYELDGSSLGLAGAQGFDPVALKAIVAVNEEAKTPTVEAVVETPSSTVVASTNSTNDNELIRYLVIEGNEIPYTDSFLTDTAPTTSAGLWNGRDSVTDGSWGYFIGHNPGLFSCILDLQDGSPVTVYDSDGNSHVYHVIDEFNVANTTTWGDIENRVTSHGESIILQTCIDGGQNYHIIVAD